jgi:apolipoprotein N-acyltransferase
MVRGLGRFDRRVRPADDTDVFPAVKDDDTGQIPVPAAAADAEVTGVIAAIRDVEDDDAVADLESQDAEPPVVGDARLAELRDQAVRVGKYLGQRLVYLTAVLVAWLVRETRIRVPQAGRWLRPRLTRLSAATLAGLLLCASYPLFNWWWAAVIAFAVLAWVLTRPATTPVGGFGYGFLFGLAFYLPLIRWISILVGAMPLVALVLLCAVFPGIFGLAAVVVRRLPGWPIWFAMLWAAQEWLKSTIPFGRWSGWAVCRCSRWQSC